MEFLSSRGGAPGAGRGSPSPSGAAFIRPVLIIKAPVLRAHSLSKDYFRAFSRQDPLFGTGAVTMESDTKALLSSQMLPGTQGSGCEHSRLERSMQAGGPDRRTGQLGGRGRGRAHMVNKRK